MSDATTTDVLIIERDEQPCSVPGCDEAGCYALASIDRVLCWTHFTGMVEIEADLAREQHQHDRDQRRYAAGF